MAGSSAQAGATTLQGVHAQGVQRQGEEGRGAEEPAVGRRGVEGRGVDERLAKGFVQCRRAIAWLEPVDAYELLRAAGREPTLLDGVGAHPDARYAFIGATPVRTLRLGQDDEAIAILRSEWERTRFPVQDEVPFTGGWMGYFSYEFARHVEPTLPAPKPGSSVPDAFLRLYLDAVVFDRSTRTATLYCADLEGDAVKPAQRLERLAAELTPALSPTAHATPSLPPIQIAASPIPEATVSISTTPSAPSPPFVTETNATAPQSPSPVPVSAGTPATPAATSQLAVTESTQPSAPPTSPTRLAKPSLPAKVSTLTASNWQTSLTQDGFERAVRSLKDLIADGDLFQANLATRFSARCDLDAATLFRRLLEANPSPYMCLIEEGGRAIVSASPEQLFSLQEGVVRSRPIAGTRKRGATAVEDEAMETELLADEKEQAEHTMLVDLVRNDVAKVARPGTVRVAERMSVERYRHVMHLVSRVEGNVPPGVGALDCLLALFPGGTITGAPKHRASLRIHDAEPVPRGAYTGSAGFVSWSGNAHFNILIRTLVLEEGRATVHAGAGIVADSAPVREWKEAQRKARALFDAVDGTPGGPPGTRLGEVTSHGTWEPARPTATFAARVLLVDNYDSFVHNLADYCATLGATVRVVRNDADLPAAVAAFRPTHAIVGPGPGWPDAAGGSIGFIQQNSGRIPILGVCLGHQAIAQAFGGKVVVGTPVHGKTGDVIHDGSGLFAGTPSPIRATRYHSLHTPEAALPPEIAVTARLVDGTVMAIRHRTHPTFGFQFHPESLCTDRGLELVARFLEQHA